MVVTKKKVKKLTKAQLKTKWNKYYKANKLKYKKYRVGKAVKKKVKKVEKKIGQKFARGKKPKLRR